MCVELLASHNSRATTRKTPLGCIEGPTRVCTLSRRENNLPLPGTKPRPPARRYTDVYWRRNIPTPILGYGPGLLVLTYQICNQIRCLPTWRYSAHTPTVYSGGPGSTVQAETDYTYQGVFMGFLSSSRQILGGKTTVSFPANHSLSHVKWWNIQLRHRSNSLWRWYIIKVLFLHIIRRSALILNKQRRTGLALSVWPIWVGSTWRKRQNSVSETMCHLNRDRTTDMFRNTTIGTPKLNKQTNAKWIWFRPPQ
jgi:hypothetical protein